MKTHDLFRIAMWWRITYGVGRVILALSILGFVGANLSDILTTLMQHELIEDPNDLLYQLTSTLISGHNLQLSIFAPAYLLFWGFIDIVLSVSLLKDKRWAFPVSITLISLFVVYEIYRVFHTHSLMIVILIGIDFLELWLINREHMRLKKMDSSTHQR